MSHTGTFKIDKLGDRKGNLVVTLTGFLINVMMAITDRQMIVTYLVSEVIKKCKSYTYRGRWGIMR